MKKGKQQQHWQTKKQKKWNRHICFSSSFALQQYLTFRATHTCTGFTKVIQSDVLLRFGVTVTMMAEEGNHGNSGEPGRRRRRTLDSYIFISVLTSIQRWHNTGEALMNAKFRKLSEKSLLAFESKPQSLRKQAELELPETNKRHMYNGRLCVTIWCIDEKSYW